MIRNVLILVRIQTAEKKSAKAIQLYKQHVRVMPFLVFASSSLMSFIVLISFSMIS